MAATSHEYSWVTKRKRVIKELLVEGRDNATQLQNLFTVGNSSNHGVKELAMKILESFTQGLSVLNSGDQIHENYDQFGSASSGQMVSQDSGESVNRSTGKGRRGCYKRRKTNDSRRNISSKLEDGYSWRKYGQKGILNSKYPRCYFRCTYKPEGCQALKQVQQLEDDSKMFNITYFGQHTCKRSSAIVKPAQTFSEPNSDLKPCILQGAENKSSPNEHKEETSDDQLFNYHILDSAISWQDNDVTGLKSCNKPPMFLSSEIKTNDHMDPSVGYICGSPSSYELDDNMDMSLIRSLEFENWDFHCDQMLSSVDLQPTL